MQLDTEDTTMRGARWFWNDDKQLLDYSISGQVDKNVNKKKRNEKGKLTEKSKLAASTRPFSSGKGRDRLGSAKQIHASPDESDSTEVVTLHNIKDVAAQLVSTGNAHSITAHCRSYLNNPYFDRFLLLLMRYFHWFFEKRNRTFVATPSHIEPSPEETAAYAEACRHVTRNERHVADAYCQLVLGVGAPDQHHMECGAARVSATKQDRRTHEAALTFLNFCVWVCFKRRDHYHELIGREIGRLLRTPAYNPASRTKQYKEEEKRHWQKMAVGPPDQIPHIVARCARSDRPSVKALETLRSPALVSILPHPRESATHLFVSVTNPTTADSQDTRFPVVPKDGDQEDELDNDDEDLKIGILGDLKSLYNPNLAPMGSENEEGSQAVPETEPGEGTERENPRRKQTAMSHATTGGNLSDDEMDS